MRVIKSEEERHVMERKVAETEVIVHRMVEEAERRQHEAETLRKEVGVMVRKVCLILTVMFRSPKPGTQRRKLKGSSSSF